MLGRKPVPTTLKKLRGSGNATREKARGKSPKPAGQLRAPPGWMNEAQKAGWRYALRHAPAGLLTPIDSGVLTIWVLAEFHLRTAAMMQDKLDSEPDATQMLMKGGRGVIMVSPYIGIMHKAAAVMVRAGEQLGFTPAARPRLASGEKAQEDADNPWTMLRVLQGGKA